MNRVMINDVARQLIYKASCRDAETAEEKKVQENSAVSVSLREGFCLFPLSLRDQRLPNHTLYPKKNPRSGPRFTEKSSVKRMGKLGF